MTAPHGPYETEREAHAAAHADIQPEDSRSVLSSQQNAVLLLQACDAAGVELGKYDYRVIEWIAGFEDATCAVLAGLVARAAGNRGGAS